MDFRLQLARTALLGAALFGATDASALLFRAYLSAKGSDANPCTVAAPCRLLPAALAAVADGGEVWMLDSANYNTAPVAISKSVTILAVPSAVGSVVALGDSAITIGAGAAKVVLRNLSIGPLPGTTGYNGIVANAPTRLTLERCTIAGLAVSAIEFAVPGTLRVIDSVIRDNGYRGILLGSGARATITGTTLKGHAPGAAIWGSLDTPGTLTTLDVVDSILADNAEGIRLWSQVAGAAARGSVARTAIVGSAQSGIALQSDANAAVHLSVSDSHLAGNRINALALLAGSRLWMSRNTVVDGEWGLDSGAALVESTSDNAVRNNDTNRAGDLVVVPRL